MQTSNIPFTIVENLNNITMLYGVYLQDIWQVNEKLTVTAGIRYDGVSGIINNNMLSPRDQRALSARQGYGSSRRVCSLFSDP